MNYTIRKGKEDDLDQVMSLIQELADYEKEGDQVIIDSSYLKDAFGAKIPKFDFLVAELDNKIVGTAIFYLKFSTWQGTSVYLEDLIVNLEYREHGIGGQLLKTLANFAFENEYKRVEWQVLDWNEPAIKFYKKHKALLDSEWINCKFDFEILKRMQNEGV